MRNNDLGVAGIAGGDITTTNAGAQLFCMRINNESYFNANSTIADAIIEGALYNPATGYGYGLHIMNHSWGGSNSQTQNLLITGARIVNRNKCVYVASRGNVRPGTIETDASYPGCLRDAYILNVGGSGVNGLRKKDGNGDPNDANDNAAVTMKGHDIDVMAPATKALVFTTDNANNTGYVSFNGTSSAAPHVSGVSALLLAQQNVNGQYATENLAPEDVEYLIQTYAEDKGSSGYDDETGWGLLDAGNALQHADYPFYKIYHSEAPNSTTTTVANNTQVVVADANGIVSAGNYIGDRHTIIHSYTKIFPSTTTILGGWLRPSGTIGYSAANPIRDDYNATETFTLIDNVASVTLVTNAYYLETNYLGQTINTWIPAAPADIKTAFSLHLLDGAVGIENDTAEVSRFFVFPNPAKNLLNYNFSMPNTGYVSIEIATIAGQVMLTEKKGLYTAGAYQEKININSLTPGMYICKLTLGHSVFYKKIVVQQ